MKIKVHPAKYENNNIITLHDNLLMWKDEISYNRRWQTRCDNCLSLCCLLEPGGFFYNYLDSPNNGETEEEKNKLNRNFDNAKTFWNLNMGIMWASDFELDERISPDDLSSMRVCSLAVNGKCIIYENRPIMCRIYKCAFAQSKYLGVK